jgi:iron transport multicopper oxidase
VYLRLSLLGALFQYGSTIAMALSLSNFLVTLLLLLPAGLIPAANADTVTYDWNIGWTTANPDGQAERRVIGINGQWPIPLLNITKGDRVVVNLHNQVGLHSDSEVTCS